MKWALLCLGLCVGGCFNPFAPRLEEVPAEESLLADQRTVEGLFRNFRYAYVWRDTAVYGRLLDSAFTFTYRNYERGVDVTWGRSEDLQATAGLFRAAQHIELVWHEIVAAYGDSVQQDVSRSFALAITFSSADIVRVYGRATFRLRRERPDAPWQIVRWRDESDY